MNGNANFYAGALGGWFPGGSGNFIKQRYRETFKLW
jgi:hypothetical protein